MYSKESRQRGIAKIGVSTEGNLRVQLPSKLSQDIYGIKQKYIPTGLSDTKENRKLAQAKADSINADIAYERFDSTLEKYGLGKSKYTNLVQFPNSGGKAKPSVDLKELWDKYTKFKTPQLSPQTLYVDYQKYFNHIQRFPVQEITFDGAIKVRDYLLTKYSLNTTKRVLMNVSAACNWAVQSKLIDINPFDGMAQSINIDKAEDIDINPFSKEERNLIIETFKKNQYYKYYTSLVEFLFYTGCRPSEALALQWKQVSDRILFEQVVSRSNNGLVIKKGLKTQQKRKIAINYQVKTILDLIRPDECNLEDLIFSSPEGGLIDFSNFGKRAWKTILTQAGIEYRKPYQMRHSFITHQVQAGVSTTQVAKWVGNSTKVIEEHYLGDVSHILPAEI